MVDDKKFQKALNILLQQQATTHATGEMTKEQQKEHEKRISRLERATVNLYLTTVEQGKEIEKVTESIKEMREAHREDHKGMNERLNAVIFMAEKYFSGENGKSKK